VRYLLDTSAVVDVFRRRYGVAARLAALSPDDIRVSAMTVAELTYGSLNSSDPVRNQAQVDAFLQQVATAAFGRRAAAAHARIRMASKAAPIGPADMVIAATALAARMTIVTSNMGEFQRVPGLLVENWRT
jgi:tRNA(fMet)-specific endonuclease VapC